MATSGNFTTSKSEGYSMTFAWTLESQDQATNISKIAWTVTLNSDSYPIAAYSSGELKIDGVSVYQSTGGFAAAGSVVASGTTSLEHDANGNKTFSVEMKASLDAFDISVSGKQSFTLPTITKMTGITSAADTTLGNKCSVKWTPINSTYKYKLKFSMGSWSYTTDYIQPRTTAAYTYAGYTIPYETANQIPNSKTGTMSVVLMTYSSANALIGTSEAVQFTVTVPQALAPTVAFSVTAVDSYEGSYIQNKSAVKVDFTGSGAQYGASLTSKVFYVGTAQYPEGTSDTITTSGTVTIRGIVTDSRGFASELSKTIEVLAYNLPAIIPYSGNKVVCERTSDNKLKIEAGRQYSKLIVNGAQKNYCTLSYRYAQSGGGFSGWVTLLAKADSSDKISVLAGVTLDEKKTYTVELKAEDDLGGVRVISFALSTGEATFHLKAGGKGAAFGKYAEHDNLFDVAWEAKFHEGINGVYMQTATLSTTKLNLSTQETVQSIFVWGAEVYGVISKNGTSITWTGTGTVTCSTSGNTITATMPSTGTFVAISGKPFEIST